MPLTTCLRVESAVNCGSSCSIGGALALFHAMRLSCELTVVTACVEVDTTMMINHQGETQLTLRELVLANSSLLRP